MGRLTVAAERKLSRSADPDAVILMLGLPLPGEASNAQSNQLKPLYNEILRDIKENKEKSTFLLPLFETDETQDKAILILYLLEFPGIVRTVRGDVTGISGCTNREQFELVDIADEISKNPVIGKWCRDAIAPQHQQHNNKHHHASVLASAVSLLAAVDKCYLPQAKKFIRKIIFRGRDAKRGFTDLRSDLAHLVESRTDLVPQAVVNCIMLQLHVLGTLYGEDEAMAIMGQAPNKQAFERALTRVRSAFGEPQFQMFRMLLGCSTTTDEMTQAGQVPYAPAKGQVIRCERKGCNEPGTNRCARCQLINYCSRECQVADWKTGGHKQVCKNKKSAAVDERKVQAAAVVAREKASPALLYQEQLLAQNPGIDYVIILPSGNQDVGVQLTDPMGKLCFHVTREKAAGSPKAVYGMYNLLIGNHPHLEEVIRNQLQAEYGVDPIRGAL
jgi:hypothetical protein